MMIGMCEDQDKVEPTENCQVSTEHRSVSLTPCDQTDRRQQCDYKSDESPVERVTRE